MVLNHADPQLFCYPFCDWTVVYFILLLFPFFFLGSKRRKVPKGSSVKYKEDKRCPSFCGPFLQMHSSVFLSTNINHKNEQKYSSAQYEKSKKNGFGCCPSAIFVVRFNVVY